MTARLSVRLVYPVPSDMIPMNVMALGAIMSWWKRGAR